MTNNALAQAGLHAQIEGQGDADPQETREWLDALEGVVAQCGHERGGYLLARLLDKAPALGLPIKAHGSTPYVNTIPLDQQPQYPGDVAMEERITAIVRWNALAMVVRANRPMASWAATSPAMRRLPRSSRSASTTSFAPMAKRARATWSISSRIRRPVSMPARISKDGWTKRS